MNGGGQFTDMTTRRLFLVATSIHLLAAAAACTDTSTPGSPTSPTSVGASAPPGTQSTPPAGTADPPLAPRTARYVVVFDALWSATTHPTDFPASAHFSPLVGGTHASSARFWEVGTLSTEGIQRMAEQGRTSPLDLEVMAAIAQGRAERVLTGGAVSRSPGSVSLEFEISQDFPLITLVTMVAPSPDWFTGVSGLSLFGNGQWVEELRVDLYPYDAGTDGGATFESPDVPLQTHVPIARLEGRPFVSNGSVAPVGRYTFRRLT